MAQQHAERSGGSGRPTPPAPPARRGRARAACSTHSREQYQCPLKRMPGAQRGASRSGRQRPHVASAHRGMVRLPCAPVRCCRRSRTSPSDICSVGGDVLHRLRRGAPRRRSAAASPRAASRPAVAAAAASRATSTATSRRPPSVVSVSSEMPAIRCATPIVEPLDRAPAAARCSAQRPDCRARPPPPPCITIRYDCSPHASIERIRSDGLTTSRMRMP